jgi:CheY-like chemotaxis protein
MSVVLYVEDHPPAQMLMQAIVGEMTQHRLVVAGTGAEARTLAASLRPDLYIIDLDLPDGAPAHPRRAGRACIGLCRGRQSLAGRRDSARLPG